MSLDKQIEGLFDKLDARKKTVETLRAELARKWETSCAFTLIGAATTTNIQTASVEIIERCAQHLSILTSANEAAGKMLGRPVSDRISGHSAEDWALDFKKRLATIDIREQERQLSEIENRLTQVLSPEQRRAIEVERLMKDLS